MTYSFSLFPVGLVVGLGLVLGHGLALACPGRTAAFLTAFSRSAAAGRILLVLAAIWTLWLVRTIDLGEFAPLRGVMTLAVVAATVLTWMFVEEFLSIRALGILALLGAEILLCACFLHPQLSRLLLVLLAYLWILGALFWVGLPWLLRDQLAWLTARPLRLRIAGLAGVLYGAAVLACAFLFYR